MPEPNDQVETQVEPTQPAPPAETVEGEPFEEARAMALIAKLREEIKELKPKAKKVDELTAAEQKRKEAEMTELERLQNELKTTKADLKKAQVVEMRRAAAAKVGLPLAFADRLMGETPEDLEADAKKLLEALPKAPKTPPVAPTNPGGNASTGETIAQQRARIYGQGVDVMSPEYAASHGGGVVMKEKPLARSE